MPTYQYACTVSSCGHRFEAVQTFTEPALTVCPICDGGLRKVFSPVGVVFKGSGFYRNDSRKSESKSRSSSASENRSSSEKSESTPAKESSTPAASSSSESSSSSSSASDSSSSTSTAKAAST